MYRWERTQIRDQRKCIFIAQAVIELICHNGKDQVSITADAFSNGAHQFTIAPTSNAGCGIRGQIGPEHIPESRADSSQIEFPPAGLGFRRTMSALRSMAVPTKQRSLIQ